MMNERGTRDMTATIDGEREVACLIKRGVIASELCVEQQGEGCFCPRAPNALVGFTAILDDRSETQHQTPEDKTRLSSARALLMQLRARVAGFERQPETQRFAGPALSVVNALNNVDFSRLAAPVRPKDPFQSEVCMARKQCAGFAGKKCGALLRSTSTGDLCRACRIAASRAPCTKCTRIICWEEGEDRTRPCGRCRAGEPATAKGAGGGRFGLPPPRGRPRRPPRSTSRR
jgi:hypothetical protein